jgi:F-type H+-transporting ATPase subunit delta
VLHEETIVSGMTGRYASALHSLASDRSQTDSVRKALATFRRLIDESEDLRRLVRNPMFSAQDQLKALTPILARAGIDGVAADFIKLVTSKRRLFAIADMIDGFNKLDDAEKGVTRAEITVAQPLTAGQIDALETTLQEITGGKSVEIVTKIDPALIGGLVVKLGSRMMDSSLRTKLASIRTRMKEVG